MLLLIIAGTARYSVLDPVETPDHPVSHLVGVIASRVSHHDKHRHPQVTKVRRVFTILPSLRHLSGNPKMAKPYRTQPPNPYNFSKEETSILKEEKKKWSQSPDKHSGNVMRDATNRIIEKYKEDHDGTIEDALKSRLENAVRKWVLVNCRQARSLDKKGTKVRDWRQVAYLLNKQEVLRRADKLAEKNGGTRFQYHQQALSQFCEKLSEKKRNKFKITARVWSKVGPPDSVKKQ